MSRGCWLVGPAAPLACDRNTSCEVQHELCGLNEVAETVWRTGVEVTGNVCSSRGGFLGTQREQSEPGLRHLNPKGLVLLEEQNFKCFKPATGERSTVKRRRERFKAFEPEGLGFTLA